MKKALIFILISIFLVQNTKSFWTLTSFQVNRDYIAENLCINRFDRIPVCKGQCFLDNQLEKESKQDKKQNTVFQKDFVFIIPIESEIELRCYTIFSAKKIVIKYNSKERKLYLDCIENPPELV